MCTAGADPSPVERCRMCCTNTTPTSIPASLSSTASTGNYSSEGVLRAPHTSVADPEPDPKLLSGSGYRSETISPDPDSSGFEMNVKGHFSEKLIKFDNCSTKMLNFNG
jgi:hypothetical protein